MVLDPLSALSVAASLVQFIEFSVNIISKSCEIYQSSTGTLVESGDIEQVTDNLRILSSEIASYLHSHDDPRDAGLEQMATGCQLISKELHDAVNGLKRGKDGRRHRRWSSFRQALESTLKADKIKSLQARLEMYRGQLALQLIAFVSKQQNSILEILRTKSITTRGNGFNKMNDLRHETQLDQQFATVNRMASQMDVIEKWGQSLASKEDLQKCTKTLSSILHARDTFDRQYGILTSLHYPSIRSRPSRIVQAHEKTFDWIFEPPSNADKLDQRPQFIEWLHSEASIYWISGKAGSGKSTLMKYLSDNEATARELAHWAEQSKLVLASFYFWNAGTEMERSQLGLLQSLLYEILSKEPDLIPLVCPERWNDTRTHNSMPWTVSELYRAFSNILSTASVTSKFCFFIDGIDEYEGDLLDITNALNTLARFPNVKLCLSSRPWNVFEDEWGSDASRKLYLQDLTKGDIALYVRNKFEEHSVFRALAEKDSRCYEIVQETVKRAQGVFLWVYLVVRSLREGLTNRDDFETFQERLCQLPTDLEVFFRLILDSVDTIYKEKSACTFITALEADAPFSLLTLSYLDREFENDAIGLEIWTGCGEDRGAVDFEYVDVEIYEKMRRRLEARCKGLLEITYNSVKSPYYRFSIDFLHRTVRDFLKKTSNRDALQIQSKGFEPYLVLGRGQLAAIKTAQWWAKDLIVSSGFQTSLSKAMHYAKRTELSSATTDHEMLNELWRTLDHLSSTLQCKILWCEAGPSPVVTCDSFPSYAVQHGLILYTDWLMREMSERVAATTTRPLLYSALLSKLDCSEDGFKPNTMIRTLLSRGADPNQSYNGSSPWGHFFRAMSTTNQNATCVATHQMRYQTAKLLLEHGADPNQTFFGTCLWGRYLRFCRDNPVPQELNALRMETAQLLIQYGADVMKNEEFKNIWTKPAAKGVASENEHLKTRNETRMTRYGSIALSHSEQEDTITNRKLSRRCWFFYI